MSVAFWAATLALVGLFGSGLWAGQRRAGSRPAAGATNTALIDAEFAALDAERAAGALDAGRHRDAVVALQRRLLAEAGPDAAGAEGTTAATAASPRLFAGLAVLLPAFVVATYLALGNPAALRVEAPVPAADAVSQDDVQRMVDTLAERLQGRPAGQVEDLPGWVMLARSQAALQRFGEAAAAYERAVALAPNDAQLIADLADVLTVVQSPAAPGGGAGPAPASDRAGALVERALALDPQNLKALALAGNAAFERRDTAAAVGYWRRARAIAPAGSDFANGLDRNLAEAGAAADGPARGTGASPPVAAGDTGAAPAEASPRTATGRTLGGDVRVAPALAGRIEPGDTLFVFARAVDGPRMPLAILRRPAATVPGDFTLDDGMAMSPELRLSNFDAVVVGARISRSGNALPQPGDLVGEVRADAGSGRLEIVIDRVVP